MGGGIAMSFANVGIPVTVLEVKKEALDKGIATVRKNYENSAKKGKLTAAQLAERTGLIRPTLNYADLAQADIIIEAVFEDMAGKLDGFGELTEIAKTGRILARNTATLTLNQLSHHTRP